MADKPSKEAKLALVMAINNRPKLLNIFDNSYYDVLICRVEGVDEDIWVAKPWLVRASTATHAGVTFTALGPQIRTATSPITGSVTQTIIPVYEVGDPILVSPYAGELMSPSPGMAQIKVQWVDTNMDSRFWASAV